MTLNAPQNFPNRSRISRAWPTPVDRAEPQHHLLVHVEHGHQQQQRPQQGGAVVLAGLRVGAEGAGIVVADHDDQPGADNRRRVPAAPPMNLDGVCRPGGWCRARPRYRRDGRCRARRRRRDRREHGATWWPHGNGLTASRATRRWPGGQTAAPGAAAPRPVVSPEGAGRRARPAGGRPAFHRVLPPSARSTRRAPAARGAIPQTDPSGRLAWSESGRGMRAKERNGEEGGHDPLLRFKRLLEPGRASGR